MRLVHRVLLTLSLAAAALIAVDAVVLHAVVGRQFRTVERDLAVDDARRVLHGLSNNLAQLRASASDWAQWDDAYDFMNGAQVESFVEANLVFPSFKAIQANAMAFVRPNGDVAWLGAFDLATGEEMALLPEEQAAFLHLGCGGPPQQGCRPRADRGGLARLGEHPPLLMASTPVLRGDGSGPPAGVLVLGRFLDEAVQKKVAEQVRVPFALAPVAQAAAGHTPVRVGDEAVPAEAFAVTETANLLVVNAALSGLSGQPVLSLSAYHGREVMEAGQGMVNYALGLLVAALLAIGGLLLWMLRRQVIQPVTRLLGRVMGARGADGDLGTLLRQEGRGDELAVLAGEFERTFAQLEETRRRLVEQSFYTGMAELAGGMTHNLRNALTPAAVRLWRLQGQLDDKLLGRMEAALDKLPAAEPGSQPALVAAYLRAGLGELRRQAATAREDLGLIGEQVRHMQAILADHERFSRTDREAEPVALEEAVAAASRQLVGSPAVALAVDKGLADLPPAAGNAVVLAQVFGNLLVNAEESILATARGSGTIAVSGRLDVSTGTPVVEIRFTDDGLGIPAERMAHIFERGFSTKRPESGGIGLHWCANSLAGMGGGITAESEGPGRGASFIVRLPASLAGTRATAGPPARGRVA